jgi:large subunit ribosomal protein L24e
LKLTRKIGKEMVVDSTLLFAARRNVPVRYNRESISTTLEAMKKVADIHARRERVFYKKRMAGNKLRQRELDTKLVAESEHLLPQERASERLRREAEEMGVETMEVAGIMETRKQRVKQRLLVGGGVEEEMDVD